MKLVIIFAALFCFLLAIAVGTLQVANAAAYLDTDGDGFYDPVPAEQVDACPTEPGVAPDGCPAAPAVVPGSITQGGTYSGERVGSVTISTTQPVTIENCNISAGSDLVKATVAKADVTIRNCVLAERHPGTSGQFAGYAFYSDASIGRLVFEHNHIQGTRGVLVRGWTHGTPGETLKIRYNEQIDCNGRTSTATGWSNSIKHNNQARFSGNREIYDVPGFEIAWNRVVNDYGSSSCEDHISFYDAGGNGSDDYSVHDNLIDGAYEVPNLPSGSGVYSGGGTITDGTSPSDSTKTDKYITFDSNVVIDSQNYGTKITQGHHNKLLNSTTVRDCLASDGTNYCNTSHLNGGAGVALDNAKNTSYFGYHTVTGNRSGWDPKGDFNLQTGDCGTRTCTVTNNTAIASTTAGEEAIRSQFYADAQAAGITFGPATPGP